MKDTIRDVTCTLVSLLLFATSLRYIKDFWLLAFIYSFHLHVALLALITSISVFILWRNRWSVLLIVWSAALFGHGLMLEREFSASGQMAANSQPFRVVSFNILQQNYEGAPEIAAMLNESQADAVFLMEARPIVPFLAQLQQNFPFHAGCGEVIPSCDLLILSRHPLKNSRFHTLSDLRQNRFATTVAEWNGREINLAAIHLSKPYFDNYHEEELWRASRVLGKLQGPLILGGDFNSSGIAPDMRRFLAFNGLYSADRREPATWPVRAGYFGIPIDHIYTRAPGFITSLERLGSNFGSNHFGLRASVAIPE